MANITLSPDPPHQGDYLTICLREGTYPNVLEITIDPGKNKFGVLVTEDAPCVTILLPANAVNVIVEDSAGEAPYRDVPVAP